jgi:hypothetical protein
VTSVDTLPPPTVYHSTRYQTFSGQVTQLRVILLWKTRLPGLLVWFDASNGIMISYKITKAAAVMTQMGPPNPFSPEILMEIFSYLDEDEVNYLPLTAVTGESLISLSLASYQFRDIVFPKLFRRLSLLSPLTSKKRDFIASLRKKRPSALRAARSICVLQIGIHTSEYNSAGTRVDLKRPFFRIWKGIESSVAALPAMTSLHTLMISTAQFTIDYQCMELIMQHQGIKTMTIHEAGIPAHSTDQAAYCQIPQDRSILQTLTRLQCRVWMLPTIETSTLQTLSIHSDPSNQYAYIYERTIQKLKGDCTSFYHVTALSIPVILAIEIPIGTLFPALQHLIIWSRGTWYPTCHKQDVLNTLWSFTHNGVGRRNSIKTLCFSTSDQCLWTLQYVKKKFIERLLSELPMNQAYPNLALFGTNILNHQKLEGVVWSKRRSGDSDAMRWELVERVPNTKLDRHSVFSF